MPTTSFQTNLFDYLRIVFHRWHWISGLLAIALAGAWVWLEWIAPSRYRSSMVVMVWSRDIDNPHLRRMVEKTPLSRLISAIRDKLQVDRRLQYLACNLRWDLKQEHRRFVLEERGGALHGLSPEALRVRLREELARLAVGHEIVIRPEEPLLRRLERFDHRRRMRLEDLPVYLDTQGLARILGAGRDATDDLIQDLRNDPVFLGALRGTVLPDRPDATAVEVRFAAEKVLGERLAAEVKTPGAGNFDEVAIREILAETLAMETLLARDLYYVVGHTFHRPEMPVAWVGRLKQGLTVSPNYGNLITLQFDAVLFKRAIPFDLPANTLNHLVVELAYRMLEGEFRVLERGQWEDATVAFRRQEESFNRDLAEANRKIYNLESLTQLQMSFLREPGTPVPETPNRLGPNWTDPYLGVPQHSVHIRRMDEYLKEIQQLDAEITELQAQVTEIENWISDPRRQHILIQRRIERSDPPEVVQLKQERFQKEQELRRILRNATERHPFALRLKREIEELDAALRQRSVSSEEQTEQQENPQIAEWRKDLEDLRKRIRGKEARRGKLSDDIAGEKAKAQDAIRNQQAYQSLVERQRALSSQLSSLQQQKQEFLAKQTVDAGLQVEFETHTHPSRALVAYEPQPKTIYLVALIVGLMAAVTVVFALEYTDHSIKGTQDVKRHLGLPVLGTIPDFAFAERERDAFLQERFRWLWGRRRSSYPRRIDEVAPPPRPQRRIPAGVRWLRVAFLLALLGGGGAAAWIFGFDKIAARVRHKLMPAEAVKDAPVSAPAAAAAAPAAPASSAPGASAAAPVAPASSAPAARPAAPVAPPAAPVPEKKP